MPELTEMPAPVMKMILRLLLNWANACLATCKAPSSSNAKDLHMGGMLDALTGLLVREEDDMLLLN